MRPRTETLARLGRLRLQIVAHDDDRPRTRADCVDGPRPCPWVGCQFSLFLDVDREGGIKYNFPDLSPDAMPARESCALDVADRGAQSMLEVGALMNLTEERIRQIEIAAKALLRLRGGASFRALAEEVNERGLEDEMAAKRAKKKRDASQAPNGTPVRQAVERARYKERLPVRIEPTAVAAKADELACVFEQRAVVLEQKREANAAFRETLNGFTARLTELAESVRSKTEVTAVECVEQLIVETNEIQIVRLDTGEVVSTRAAEAADRQEALPLDDGPAPDDFDEGEDAFDDEARPQQAGAKDARAGDGG